MRRKNEYGEWEEIEDPRDPMARWWEDITKTGLSAEPAGGALHPYFPEPEEKPKVIARRKLRDDPHFDDPLWMADPNNPGVMTEKYNVKGTKEYADRNDPHANDPNWRYNPKTGVYTEKGNLPTQQELVAKALEQYGTPGTEYTDIGAFAGGKGKGTSEAYNLLSQQLGEKAQKNIDLGMTRRREEMAKRGIAGGVEEGAVSEVQTRGQEIATQQTKDIEIARLTALQDQMNRENDRIVQTNLQTTRDKVAAQLAGIYNDTQQANLEADREYNKQWNAYRESRRLQENEDAQKYNEYQQKLAQYEAAQNAPYEMLGAALPVLGTVAGAALGSPWLGSALGTGGSQALDYINQNKKNLRWNSQANNYEYYS